mgnify:CR=1 FL=1
MAGPELFLKKYIFLYNLLSVVAGKEIDGVLQELGEGIIGGSD